MTWTALRDRLQNHAFEIVQNDPRNKKDWTFRPTDGLDNVFITLGAGTNKIAVRVEGTPWVLLFGKNGRHVERTSFREEVDTLKKLGAAGLKVPKPFDGGGQAVYLFDITVFNDGEEPVVPAFLQECMARDEYVEMTKTTPKARDDFAKDCIITGGRLPATIDTTIRDLENIQRVFDADPWGDFQVMYHKLTGSMVVFDPLPNDPNRAAYKQSIATWLKDIRDLKAAAADSSRRLQEQVARLKKTNHAPTGGLVRRNSIG